jgi:sec-independent protein translocase protein TatA
MFFALSTRFIFSSSDCNKQINTAKKAKSQSKTAASTCAGHAPVAAVIVHNALRLHYRRFFFVSNLSARNCSVFSKWFAALVSLDQIGFPTYNTDIKEIAMFGSLGIWEILLIVAVIALLFGGRKLPELGKGLGQAIKNFKSAVKGADKDEEKPKDEKGN